MKKTILFLLPVALVFLFSCDSGSDTADHSTDSTKLTKDTVKGPVEITLTPLEDSPGFADAILELSTPAENAVLKDNKVTFNYEIKNYKLSEKTTEGSCAMNCANSGKGQHIHLILNNAPYQAKYDTKFVDTLEDGHYVALSFLSRSYHESIKHYEAYDLRQFTVGKAKVEKVDLTKPLMFYSRPKGEYVGADTKKILLDFYLVNTQLSEGGNQVKVTINGSKEFIVTKWIGYIMEGLPMGENTIKLELLDKDGNPIPGPYNVVERKFTLKESKTS